MELEIVNVHYKMDSSSGAPTLTLGRGGRKVFGRPPSVASSESASGAPPRPAIKLAAKKTTIPPPPKEPQPLSEDEYDSEESVSEYSYSYSEEDVAEVEEKKGSQQRERSGDGIPGMVCDMVENADGARLKRGMDELEQWQKQLLDAAEPLEKQQMSAWFAGVSLLLKQQNMAGENNGKYAEVVTARARDAVRRRRFAHRDSASHVFRIAVCGPRQSGKSTLIGVLAREAIVDMLASGDWKSTFVFPLDLSLISHLLSDVKAFYKAMVQLTFQALAVQRPLTAQFANGLVHAFENVVEGNPLLPKAFTLCEDFRLIVPDVRKVIDILSLCWSDPTALAPFMTNVFKLPMLIGDVFGFKRYLTILDHVDAADVTMRPMEPFTETDSNLFVIELVKFMLTSSSFLVSCRNYVTVSNVFANLNENSIDLNDGVEFMSTLDVVEMDENDRSKELVVNFEQNETQFVLKPAHFGGCAAYIEKWRDLMAIADDIEKRDEEEEDSEEQKLTLNTAVQAVIKQLFTQPKGEPVQLSVKSVTRVKAKNTTK